MTQTTSITSGGALLLAYAFSSGGVFTYALIVVGVAARQGWIAIVPALLLLPLAVLVGRPLWLRPRHVRIGPEGIHAEGSFIPWADIVRVRVGWVTPAVPVRFASFYHAHGRLTTAVSLFGDGAKEAEAIASAWRSAGSGVRVQRNFLRVTLTPAAG